MTLTTPGMAIETRETATASRMFALGGCIGRVVVVDAVVRPST